MKRVPAVEEEWPGNDMFKISGWEVKVEGFSLIGNVVASTWEQ